MSIEIFSKKGENFLKNDMCICMDDLKKKILNDAPNEVDFFKQLIDCYVDMELPHNPNNKLNYNKQNENYIIFQKKLLNFNSKNISKYNSKVLKIYEEICHALRSYTREGLLGVWLHREASSWYPKIIINKNIGTMENINSLSEIVTIYRGTSEDEFNSNQFNQAWSLSKKIAESFAFIHYQNKPNYINTIRVICKAKIYKRDIYYYRKGHFEKEIIINSSKLITNTIKIIDRKKI